MPRRQVLDQIELKSALSGLSGWEVVDGKLTKTFKNRSYSHGVLFTVAIAQAAEAMDHHPDLTLTWPSVKVETSTHDAGGVTPMDIELAKRIEALA